MDTLGCAPYCRLNIAKRQEISTAGRTTLIWRRSLRCSFLQKVDPELARIVELPAFGGLTIEEAAHILKVPPSTATRD